MESPFTGGAVILKRETKEMTVRKENFEIVYHYYLCEDTNERFTTDEIDNIDYNQANNKYREKHCFPFPDEIKNIREKYGLSASKMSEVLGFGINMYRSYEAGELPSASNAKLIILAKEPEQFQKLLNHSNAFKESTLERLNKKVKEIIASENEKKVRFKMNLKRYFLGDLKPGHLTGYKKPSLKKITEMVVFFSQELKPWKTALNKLLFYSDFFNYKKTGFAISGLNYRAILMGPVPDKYDSIFEYIANGENIKIEKHLFDDGIGEQFKTCKNRAFNADIFSDIELETLKTVASKFKSTNTKDIIEISHKEKAWLNNYKAHNLIDYQDGFDLLAL